MSNSTRDTHFQGFANLLCDEEKLSRFLDDPYVCSSGMRQEIVTLIAQRAYDLAVHILTQQLKSDYYSYPEDSAHQAIRNEITDLTEWR